MSTPPIVSRDRHLASLLVAAGLAAFEFSLLSAPPPLPPARPGAIAPQPVRLLVKPKPGALLPAVPNGTMVYKWNGTGIGYDIGTFYVEGNESLWDCPYMSLNPGEGVIVHVPGTDPTTVWFKGNILQGDLSLPLPGDYWICACKRPWSATLGANMAFPMELGDQVYRINPGSTISYTEYCKGTNGQWSPCDPTLNYAEPFWSYKAAATEWNMYWLIPSQ